MNDTKARRIILGAAVVTGLLAVSRDLTRGEVPLVGVLLGVMGVAVVLSLLSEVAPKLAAMLAVLVMTGAWTSSGPLVLNALASIVGGRNRT